MKDITVQADVEEVFLAAGRAAKSGTENFQKSFGEIRSSGTRLAAQSLNR